MFNFFSFTEYLGDRGSYAAQPVLRSENSQCQIVELISLRGCYWGRVSDQFEGMQHAVPQGFILGPLLFLIYCINVINKIADDTERGESGHGGRKHELNGWFDANRLVLKSTLAPIWR